MDERTRQAAESGGFMKLAGIDEGEYDALADLFLGDSELAPEPFSNTGTDSVENHASDHPCATCSSAV